MARPESSDGKNESVGSSAISTSHKVFRPLPVLGWALGAMSLMNLAHEAANFRLFGRLEEWVFAYGLLVKRVGEFLFGWIHLGWITISAEEHHVLVLAIVLGSAASRAEYRHQRGKDEDLGYSIVAAFGFVGFLFVWPFLPALLLPGYWGVGGSLVGLTLAAVARINTSLNDKDLSFAPNALLRRELVGILSLFVVLVAVNYAYSRGAFS
jgi:hypothetical protein